MGRSRRVWSEVVALARRQRGPVALRQALELGLSRSTWDDRLREEGWERPFRTVTVLPGAVVDAEVRARAAALAIGHEAMVTGRSALHLTGVVDVPPVRVHLVVPARCQPRPLAGVRITRSRTLAAGHGRVDGGIVVAGAPRALLDAAAATSRARLREWLIDGRQRGLVEVAEVAAFVARAPNACGRARLLAACDDVTASAADSALVHRVEQRLRRAGIAFDVPARTVDVGGRVLHPDVTLVGTRVGIEVDGYGSHSSRRALDLDQRKHNAYALAGWVVLRINWSRLTEDWDGFLDELRRALRRG